MIPGWLDAIEHEVTTCLCGRESLSPPELAARLGISEEGAVSYVCLLASEGRLTIERVSLPRADGPALSRRGERYGISAGATVD